MHTATLYIIKRLMEFTEHTKKLFMFPITWRSGSAVVEGACYRLPATGLRKFYESFLIELLNDLWQY